MSSSSDGFLLKKGVSLKAFKAFFKVNIVYFF